VADTVNLHAGKGTEVSVPERMTVTFQPFAIMENKIVLDVKIKPVISDDGQGHVPLSAPALDAVMTGLISDVGTQLTEATDIEPLWTV
jgi:hypothetical protein